MYGTYQKFEYNTCPIRFPVGKAAKALLFVVVFALMIVAGVAVFAAVHMVAVLALSVVASVLAAVASFVVTVASAALSAAAYAVTTLAAVVVCCVIVLALIRALPVLWRAAVVVWAHRDGLLVVGRGLVLCAVVVSVFVVALVWLPAIIAGCCTVLPQVATVAGVLGGVVGLMKVG